MTHYYYFPFYLCFGCEYAPYCGLTLYLLFATSIFHNKWDYAFCEWGKGSKLQHHFATATKVHFKRCEELAIRDSLYPFRFSKSTFSQMKTVCNCSRPFLLKIKWEALSWNLSKISVITLSNPFVSRHSNRRNRSPTKSALFSLTECTVGLVN